MKTERQSKNEKRRDARIRAADEDDPDGERMDERGGRSGTRKSGPETAGS